MLVGSAPAAPSPPRSPPPPASARFVVDQVVTAGAPSAQVPRIPDATRVLSLEDRSDPVALLGSLINAAHRQPADRRLRQRRTSTATHVYVAGARAADSAEHPELRAEITRMQDLGYLAGLRRSRARTPRAGRGCGTPPSARARRTVRAALSPVSQWRGCSGLSHQACRAASGEVARTGSARSL